MVLVITPVGLGVYGLTSGLGSGLGYLSSPFVILVELSFESNYLNNAAYSDDSLTLLMDSS